MKPKLNKNQPKQNDSKTKKFDDLVKELQNTANTGGCCSDQNACDLRCSPLNGGCNNNEDGGCR